MMNRIRPARALLAGTLLIVLCGAGPTGTLTFQVSNVRNAAGQVHVDVCPQAKFLKDDCTFAAAAPARIGTTTVVVRNVPAGRYAAQLFHDENGNGKTDRNLFGLPKEGVGFSRDAPIRMSPPKWADAFFDVAGGAQTLPVKMRYFLGESGPKG